MKARKQFIVVAYDITKTKQRNKVSEVLEQYGKRVNLSVFECMLTVSQLRKLRVKITGCLNPKTDKVIYYPLCIECFSKIVYDPPAKVETHDVVSVV